MKRQDLPELEKMLIMKVYSTLNIKKLYASPYINYRKNSDCLIIYQSLFGETVNIPIKLRKQNRFIDILDNGFSYYIGVIKLGLCLCNLKYAKKCIDEMIKAGILE